MFKNIFCSLRGFFRDHCEGAAIVLIGASAAFMALFVVVSIDTTRVQLTKNTFRAALDAACLGGGQEVNENAQDEREMVRASAIRFFNANYPKDYLNSKVDASSMEVTYGTTAGVEDKKKINCALRGKASTVFGNMIGVDEVDIDARSQVTRMTGGPLELALALDVTASMNSAAPGDGASKLSFLKQGVGVMVNEIFGNNSIAPGLFVSVVPFNISVNVGNKRLDWIKCDGSTPVTDVRLCVGAKDGVPPGFPPPSPITYPNLRSCQIVIPNQYPLPGDDGTPLSCPPPGAGGGGGGVKSDNSSPAPGAPVFGDGSGEFQLAATVIRPPIGGGGGTDGSEDGGGTGGGGGGGIGGGGGGSCCNASAPCPRTLNFARSIKINPDGSRVVRDLAIPLKACTQTQCPKIQPIFAGSVPAYGPLWKCCVTIPLPCAPYPDIGPSGADSVPAVDDAPDRASFPDGKYPVEKRTYLGHLAVPGEMKPFMRNKGKILSAVNSLRGDGYTRVWTGAMWGWRTLSPKWRGQWEENTSLPFDAERSNKIMVLMTDGANIVNGVGLPERQKDYDSLTQICSAMKAQNIRVITIAYSIASVASPPADKALMIQTLRDCASEPKSENFYESPDGPSLVEVFRKIANLLTSIRLSQ